MDELRLEPVAASVAAWHNRQPLACRIGLAQVLSVGVVRLPFARGGPGRPRAAFSERFLPPWSVRRIGRWAARHGQHFTGELADDVRRRDVATDPKCVKAGETVVTLWLRTAVVEVDGRQRRVLIGPGARPAVLGRPFLHRPRVVLAATAAVALLMGAGLLVQRAPTLDRGGAAVPVWSAASAAASLAAAAAASTASDAPLPVVEAPAVATAAEPAPDPASEPAPAPVAADAAAAPVATAPAAPPLDVEPRWGRVDLPGKPLILERRRTPAFGLASAVLRTEGESERVQGLMQRLLGKTGAAGVHVERLQVGEDWRIVGYPFASRDAAERFALALAKGGLRTEVVDF